MARDRAQREAVAALAEASDALVEEIKPYLAGKGSALQGLVLAELVAIWIAGHIAPGDPQATREMQGEMLLIHEQTVADLIEHYKARRG